MRYPKLHTDNLVVRVGATLLAIGWVVAGAFAIYMSNQAPTADLADRALWMGITFCVAAGVALPVSWLVSDLSNIWCIPPRKTPQRRIDLDE